MILHFVVLLCSIAVIALTIKLVWFTPPEAKPSAECAHEWEPWSEPKDTPEKVTTTYYQTGGTKQEVLSEQSIKVQDRVCSKCNIYERRTT